MIDLSYLKITTNDDTELIAQLVGIFKNQLPELKNDITNSFHSKQWKMLMESAHKAKNSFQMMGIELQAEELKRIEMIARDAKENTELEQLINRFANTCKIVEAEIENIVLQ